MQEELLCHLHERSAELAALRHTLEETHNLLNATLVKAEHEVQNHEHFSLLLTLPVLLSAHLLCCMRVELQLLRAKLITPDTNPNELF